MISYLQVDNLSKRFGEQLLFENISFGIGKGQKVALIAKNGMGKSTLLRIIAGKDTSESGTVIFRNDITVGILDQDPALDPENSVFEEVFHSDSPVLKLIKAYEEAVAHNHTEALEKLIPEMDIHSAWDYDTTIKQILSELKIDTYDKKIGQLSGGQKKRVGLAKVLISNPDFLILDEPTNHLDIEMTEWLEEYLGKSNATLLMVTHDRYFLDRVCNQIIEIDEFGLFSYSGNYAYYLEKREERIENRNAAIDKARNLLRTEQEWMRRMPQARSHKAQYRIDNFYKLKETASQNTTEKKLELDIQGKRLGKKILELDHVSKSFDGHCILRDFSYKFVRGEKIGIVGKNGVGKSTFLNIITQNLQPDSGSISIGETVVYGYYKQSGIAFNETDRVIDIVKNIAERIDLGNGRIMSASQFLEYFMFTDKQQYSLVEKLSGGERRRLYLLTVLMGNPNFLILDEPTNDLDIITLNVLEEYLKGFKGCLLIVSHDRFFTDKVVDRIFAFEGNGIVKDFPGNYTIYKNKKEEEKEQLEKTEKEKKKTEQPQSTPNNSVEKKRKLSFKERQEMQQLETDMEQLNTEKTIIETADFPKALLNSCILTAGVVVLNLIVSSLAGYALAKWKSRWSACFMLLFLSSMFVPFHTIMISLLSTARDLHVTGHIWGLILIYCGLQCPIPIFLIRGFVSSVPGELEEAALLDGCGVLKRFVLIVLPLIKPILTTVAILNVLWVWNDFLLPYLILGKPITIPLSQMYFYGQYNQQWHLIMAGFVVTTIPVILFYIFMQKNIVNGIAAGAIKG